MWAASKGGVVEGTRVDTQGMVAQVRGPNYLGSRGLVIG